jgi:putative peptidoglycan lipid II flippase
MADALGGSGPAGRLVELDREPPPHRSWFRTWVAVPLAVLVLAAAVVVVGLSFGGLEIGGPVGIRLREASPPASAPTEHPLRIRSVSAFDPLGDGHETDDQAPLATDGNATTGWRTENYFDGKLFKPGVGLVLDLGGERTVTGFRLQTQAPGFSFEVLVGDDPQTLIGETSAAYAAPATRHALAPRTGRYVVVWITSVVPVSDGHRAEVDEIQVFGSG